MADIIGIVIAVAPPIIRYIIDLTDGPEERRQLAMEIASAAGILTMFQNLQHQPGGQSTRFSSAIEALSGPNKALCQFADLLERVEKQVKPLSGLKKVKRLTWPFTSSQIKEYLDKIKSIKLDFILALEVENYQANRVNDDKIDAIASDTALLVTHSIQAERERNQDEIEQILAWVSTSSHQKKQSEILKTRHVGTAEWIFGTQQFQRWFSGSTEMLRCHGVPGAGKTVITSSVVDYLTNASGSSYSVRIASVYFDHKERDRQTFAAVLGSVVRQLLSDQDKHFETLREAFRRPTDPTHFGPDRRHIGPDIAMLEGLLFDVVKDLDKVYLIIDALDESSEETSDLLLDLLRGLHEIGPQVKTFITSRPSLLPTTDFEKSEAIQIVAKDRDIESYVDFRIESSTRLSRKLRDHPDSRKKLVETVLLRSQGMFLLARLHMDSLKSIKSLTVVEEALAYLPQGTASLKMTYDDAVQRIRSQHPRDVAMAERILAWVCFSARPMNSLELRLALTVDLTCTDEDFDPARLLPEEILVNLCAGLVSVGAEGGEVRFIHLTVQEYFIAVKDSLFPEAHNMIFRTCLRFLSYRKFSRSEVLRGSADAIKQFVLDVPFLAYAEGNFSHHATLSHTSVTNELLSFFADQGCLNLLLSVRGELNSCPEPSVDECCPKLTIAVMYKLPKLVELFVKDKQNINQKGTLKLPPLHEASFSGVIAFFDMIFEAGFDCRIRDITENTVLHRVACDGLPEKVDIILGKYPQIIDWQNVLGKTALMDAAERNQFHVVEKLLQAGANANLKDDHGSTALTWATEIGAYKITGILLDHGADTSGNTNGWPLVLDCATTDNVKGGVECLKQYMKHENFDFRKTNSKGISALHHAVAHNKLAIARLLMEADKNDRKLIHMKNFLGKTPLHDAAHRGRFKLAEELLLLGADINAVSNDGRTPLDWARDYKKPKTIEMLLQHGALPGKRMNTEGKGDEKTEEQSVVTMSNP